jgi:AraC-like DNA-binding protein
MMQFNKKGGIYVLEIIAPPLPSFLAGGKMTYQTGQYHPDRRDIGVFDLLIVTEGCLFLGEQGEKYEVAGGQFLILYPNGHHYPTAVCQTETHFYWFHFLAANRWKHVEKPASEKCERVKRRNLFSEQPFAIRLPKYGAARNMETVERICRQLVHSLSDTSFFGEWQRHIWFQQLLQELCMHTAADTPSQAAVVAERAAEFLRKNYYRKINYRDLGEALRFHPNHIARCMRAVLDCTPMEYLQKVRVEQARLLLVSSGLSIEQIAECCGFSQSAYFSRIFKRYEGMSPNEFRKQYGLRFTKDAMLR